MKTKLLFSLLAILLLPLVGCADPESGNNGDPGEQDAGADATSDTGDDACPDADGDGVCDAQDRCPGSDDTVDSDSDTTPDCLDLCPDDPEKVESGVCGCGSADADSDSDGVPDCFDDCPDDDNKTAEGTCGCGASEADTDSDGSPDCVDECVDDPDKTAAGVCGCGVSDVDTDGDGELDCDDGCVDDPDKTEAGICGCGVPDDANSNGVADCNECTTQSGTMQFESDAIDLNTGTVVQVDFGFADPEYDFKIAYNGGGTVHAVLFQYQNEGREIAHLRGEAFASVTLNDVAGATFTTSLIDERFDDTRVILLRTDTGDVYKLGNPVENGSAGTVDFDYQQLTTPCN